MTPAKSPNLQANRRQKKKIIIITDTDTSLQILLSLQTHLYLFGISVEQALTQFNKFVVNPGFEQTAGKIKFCSLVVFLCIKHGEYFTEEHSFSALHDVFQ